MYLIFERGSFDALAGDNTALALRCYLVGLPSYGLYKIFGTTFYAIDKEKLAIAISIFCIAVNVVFCVTLTPKYGFYILALGTSISMILNSFLQICFINREIKLGAAFFVSTRVFRLLLVNGVLGSLLFFCKNEFFGLGVEMSFTSVCLSLAISFLGFCSIYLLAMTLVGDRETVVSFLKKIKKRITK